MKGKGLLAFLGPEPKDDGESDDTDEPPKSGEMMGKGGEKKEAFQDLLDAIAEKDADAGALALERFVMCCHEEE